MKRDDINMAQRKRHIYVIGHKNPDVDSICSAICYANLKNIVTKTDTYAAKRAGEINAETKYVLSRFGVEAPPYVDDVAPQVKDIEIRQVEGVKSNISLKNAWNLMRSTDVVTLPITSEQHLEGLITIGDIAKSYMDVYDSTILATAKTPYINIIETLEGELVSGDIEGMFEDGKVLVAAANPDLMESYIEKGDLVILGNRYESQLCAIEMGAKCLVVCEGAKVSQTIKKMAATDGCTIISTPHDTYTVARLINQSMPIKFFMKSDKLITFRTDAFVDDIKAVMTNVRHRDFPIISTHGEYRGMISRRNLLGLERKKIILVDHNERNQAVDGIENAEILEIIDHHRLGTIETMKPVLFRNQPLGCTATIVYQMYRENNVEVDKTTASLLCSAIISDTLMFRSPTCTPVDEMAARELAQIADIDVTELAKEMFAAGSDFRDKTPEELFFQDFKKFSTNDVEFGVGQISSMSSEELFQIRNILLPYIGKAFERQNVSMLFFMLTDVLEASSELIYFGDNAKELVESAFGVRGSEQSVYIKGMVSRKKQLIPQLMLELQKE